MKREDSLWMSFCKGIIVTVQDADKPIFVCDLGKKGERSASTVRGKLFDQLSVCNLYV